MSDLITTIILVLLFMVFGTWLAVLVIKAAKKNLDEEERLRMLICPECEGTGLTGEYDEETYCFFDGPCQNCAGSGGV